MSIYFSVTLYLRVYFSLSVRIYLSISLCHLRWICLFMSVTLYLILSVIRYPFVYLSLSLCTISLCDYLFISLSDSISTCLCFLVTLYLSISLSLDECFCHYLLNNLKVLTNEEYNQAAATDAATAQDSVATSRSELR